MCPNAREKRGQGNIEGVYVPERQTKEKSR
jgi:hypothetical protein